MSEHSLELQLRALKLPSFVECHGPFALDAERQGQSHGQYLRRLAETELNDRQRRKIERLARASALPEDKTLATLLLERLPIKVRRAVPKLCQGDFVEKAENVLAFGGPGRGKTHTLCAVGHALVAQGTRVLFTPTYRLVQRLLLAKRELLLERELKRLDRFDVVLLDDIGYVQQDREEMEVLFTFLAERYERRSVMITSNLVFSQWDRIFKDPMTTAAAIDRLVHHATILEMTGDSFRSDAAKQRKGRGTKAQPDS